MNPYFQTFIHYFSLSNKLPSIRVKNPSDWYVDQVRKIQATNAIALHIRRGDYVNLSKLHGLLDTDYYCAAVMELKSRGYDRPIWVFSDDIYEAKNLLKNRVRGITNWVTPPSKSDPIESMMLMSFACANIIANSTFSWWGAALSTEEKPIITPLKWFRGMTDPELLYPPNWIKIRNSWLD
jgi:hypothetical protein